MRRFPKVLAGFAALALLAGVLAGCGGSQQPKPATAEPPKQEAPKPAPVSLTVWSHFDANSEVPELKKLAEDWAAKTGNKVDFIADTSDFQAFATAAQSDKAPDMMFGLAHDAIGPFVAAGLVAPVPDGLINKSDYVPLAIDATTWNGKMYAVPLTVEAIALFYNPDKVKTPPKTWQEFTDSAKQVGFQYDINTFYFDYGFFGGNGAYVFKNNGGTLDAKDVGLGSDGAVKALDTLKSFVDQYKFMPADQKGDAAQKAFIDGKIGYYLSGPWEIGNFKKNNVKYAIAPMPALENGKPFQPFVGVWSAFVSAGSKKQAAAWDLMKYMIQNSPIPLYKASGRIPAMKQYQDDASVKGNPDTAAIAASAANGVPMPNIAAMNQVWTPMGTAISGVLQGKLDTKTAAANAVKAIAESIAKQG